MEIDIKEYLSEGEIKKVCEDALYSKIREDMRNLNVNDIIANISYAEVAAMVDAHIGENDYCKKAITQKVLQIIDNLSAFTVFRKADTWERQNSIAYDILQEESRAARPLIKQRIERTTMAEYITKEEALNAVEDAMELTSSEYDMIAEKIDNVPVWSKNGRRQHK